MADKKLNDLAQIPSIGSLKNIYVEDANGNQYKVSKESLAEVLGGLLSNLGVFPFMYRGIVDDLNSAVENGYYEMNGAISNAPFNTSWGPVLVFGNTWKVQIAAQSASDMFKLYARSLSNGLGWREITFT